MEQYEAKARRYCAVVEEDNDNKAAAWWDAVWHFRRSVMAAYWQLLIELREAGRTKPE